MITIDFLTSEWFMWVVMIVVLVSIVSIIIEATSENSVEWDFIWRVLKRTIMFFLAMIFLPLVIIFGRTKARKTKE